MKRVVPLLLSVLFAVNAHATPTIALGQPFTYQGVIMVPVVGANIPPHWAHFDNVNVDFTNLLTIDSTYTPGRDSLQTVWPKSTFPTLPFGQGGPYNDDIGLGYNEWYVGAGFQYINNEGPTCFNGAASSGILCVIPVKNVGSIALRQESYAKGWSCDEWPNEIDTGLIVDETPMLIGYEEECNFCEWVTAGSDAPPAAKTNVKRSSWAKVKSIYR